MGTVQSKASAGQKVETERTIALRVKQNYDKIVRALDPIQLMPLLISEKLIDYNDNSFLLGDKLDIQKSHYILKILQSKGQLAYLKFFECIQAEHDHMGHVYISSLLQNKPYGSEHEWHKSQQIKEAIQSHALEMMDIDINLLIPIMRSKGLLTDDNQEVFCRSSKTNKEKCLYMLQLLDTKGPLAHLLFADCLRSADAHPTHSELYEKLCRDDSHEQPTKTMTTSKKGLKSAVDDSALTVALPHKELFSRRRLNGPLQGEKYNRMMSTFHSCTHNGDWEKLEQEATKCLCSSIPEFHAVALLEKAISWIFRGSPEIAIKLVHKATEVIHNSIEIGENSSILLGRSEYILSGLFRYLKQYDEAREHIAKAKDYLFYIEPGEDSALLYYNDASIMVECLSESSTQQELERVDEIFRLAIQVMLTHESGPGLVIPHSLIRLAQLYLGATHYSPGMTTNEQNIEQASKCLRAIKHSSLCHRSKCYYHLTESDLNRRRGNVSSAKESLQTAMFVAKKHKFELVITSAQKRLQSL